MNNNIETKGFHEHCWKTAEKQTLTGPYDVLCSHCSMKNTKESMVSLQSSDANLLSSDESPIYHALFDYLLKAYM
jgi:hypothetical protein